MICRNFVWRTAHSIHTRSPQSLQPEAHTNHRPSIEHTPTVKDPPRLPDGLGYVRPVDRCRSVRLD